MSKINEKGVLIFYDWLDRLKEAQLEPEDALSVIYALADYSRYGENPVDKFEGPLQYAVGLMFDQIKRAEATAEAKAENARRTNEKKRANAERTQSVRKANAERTLTPTTNTNTNTDTETNTDTIPPYNPPEGEKKKKTNNHSFIIGENERDLIRKYFRIYGSPEDDEDDFIAYNEARGWKGIGDENILASRLTLERYVSRWCRSENVRFGRKESDL